MARADGARRHPQPDEGAGRGDVDVELEPAGEHDPAVPAGPGTQSRAVHPPASGSASTTTWSLAISGSATGAPPRRWLASASSSTWRCSCTARLRRLRVAASSAPPGRGKQSRRPP